MKYLDLRSLQLSLRKGVKSSIYLILTEDVFMMSEALRSIKNSVLEGASDFNFDSYFASETSVEQIRDTVETLPMFSKTRMVIVREAHLIKDKDWLSLFPLVTNPVSSACLVLAGEKLDKRKRPYKEMEKGACVVELKRPYDSQLNPWIDYIATLHGLKVSHEAAHWLKQYVGPNLAELNQEMAKVREYLGERTLVSGEDILKVVSRRQLETVFDLTKSIGCLDGPTSLIHLSRLIDAGQSEAGVVALVGRHLRILRSLKEALKDTQSPAKLAVRAGVPQFFLEEYKSQAQLWTEDKLAMATKALLETDRAIKSSPLSAHIWLENFILKTCPISRQEKDNVASRNH